MNSKNPLLIGLLNALIPGSSHVIVNKEWRKFVLVFLGNSVLIFGAYLLGTAIQDIRNSTLPLGLCPGLLILVILVRLFVSGMKVANTENSENDAAAYYKSKRTIFPQTKSQKLEKIQKQRDDGLISSEEYDTKKSDIESKG